MSDGPSGATPAVVGAVLAGGAGRRLGGPKAELTVGGVALATRVADALRAGGAREVVLVGGDQDAATRLGLPWVPDDRPGLGPLAGTATALTVARERAGDDAIVVVAPCDQPALDGPTVRSLVEALIAAPFGVAAAVPLTEDGRRHPLPAAWRAQSADQVAALVAGGARRADAGAQALGAVAVGARAAALADIDTPADLAAAHPAGGPSSPKPTSAP